MMKKFWRILKKILMITAALSFAALFVVVLTSSKQDEDMLKSYLTGVNSYIQKPVDFERFRKIVKDLVLYWLVVNQLPSPVAAVTR